MVTLINIYWLETTALANSGVTLSLSLRCHHSRSLRYHLCVCSSVTLRCHLHVCHHRRSPSGSLRHGYLLPACTTGSFIFHTGLSFLQEVSPSRCILLPGLTNAGTRTSLPLQRTCWCNQIWNQGFACQANDGHFFPCRVFWAFKSFLQTVHVLIGIHSWTSNKSASCFNIALAVVDSRGPQSKSFP